MKPVSTDMQKRILFIPCVNIFILLILVFHSMSLKKTIVEGLKPSWIVFSSSVPFLLLQAAISLCFPTVGKLLAILNVYLIPLIMGFRLIKYQESVKH